MLTAIQSSIRLTVYKIQRRKNSIRISRLNAAKTEISSFVGITQGEMYRTVWLVCIKRS